MSSKYEIEQAEVREKAKVLQGQFDELNEKAVTVDSFLRSVRQYTRAKKLNARMMNELIERIEVHQATKVDGVWVQKLTIYYHCVGALDVPDLERAPFKSIEMRTRKGVSIRNAPPSENNLSAHLENGTI